MKKEEVRAMFPEAVRLADHMRSTLGDAFGKLVHLKEGDREMGEPGKHGVKLSETELRGDAFVVKIKRGVRGQ